MWCAVLAVLCSGPCFAADPLVATRSLQQAKQQAAAQPKPPLISRETLMRQPEIDNVQLAPNGRYLSFLKRNQQHADVWLQEVATGQRFRVLPDVRGVENAWSGDGRRLWLADEQGLAVVDSTDRKAKRILRWDGARKQRYWGVDARAPAYALVSETIQHNGALSYRYLLVDANGKTRLLHASALPLRKVLLGKDGRLAFAAAYDGPHYDTVIRQYTPSGVRELARCIGIETCDPVAYSAQRGELWMLSNSREDKLALRRWQSSNGRWQTVHRDPAGIVDADDLLWNAVREDWLAIAYYRDHRHWYGNGVGTQANMATLKRHLPNANLRLASSANGRVWLVRAQQANWPIARHFLYLPDRDRLHRLFARDDAALKLPPSQHLATAQPVSWRASDGMLLHGYVYLPRGVALAKAPLIAWLHGGPFGRLEDNYDARMQLLANRGYVVFLPNFRASTGYGLRYIRAAQGDVGNGRVLKDALDGLDFLLAQGVGHRDRQAVMGHSFGGYASLLAVSHYPTRFRFAFAGAAGTDYGWMKQWQVDNESEALRGDGPPVALSFPHHGLPFANPAWRQKMRRESPLTAVSKLRVPIYLWAGAKDDRVPIKSVVHYASEAERRGKSLTLLIDPDAGHNPQRLHSAEAWLFLMERAADRHFGGGVTPASPDLNAFLRRQLRIDTLDLLNSSTK
jgi:dipeptidyl aminopeptidase/acylaminoacyl peptidase